MWWRRSLLTLPAEAPGETGFDHLRHQIPEATGTHTCTGPTWTWDR